MLIELGLFSAAFLHALAWKKLEFYRVSRDLHWHAGHANPNILHPWGIPLNSVTDVRNAREISHDALTTTDY